jgi:hypothetical protein
MMRARARTSPLVTSPPPRNALLGGIAIGIVLSLVFFSDLRLSIPMVAILLILAILLLT